MWNAIHGGNQPCGGATLAEGIAVSNAGKLTLPVVRELVSDIILVDEPLIERAVNAFLTLQKTMAEGAGAAGLAAMLAAPERFAGRKVGLILCGGNIDPRILASIMVRELERDDRIVSFRLTIPDRPGILGQIASRLGRTRRQYSRRRSPPAVSRRAGQGRQARRHHGDARRRPCRGNFPRAGRRRLSAGAHGKRRRAGVSAATSVARDADAARDSSPRRWRCRIGWAGDSEERQTVASESIGTAGIGGCCRGSRESRPGEASRQGHAGRPPAMLGGGACAAAEPVRDELGCRLASAAGAARRGPGQRRRRRVRARRCLSLRSGDAESVRRRLRQACGRDCRSVRPSGGIAILPQWSAPAAEAALEMRGAAPSRSRSAAIRHPQRRSRRSLPARV